ncbi:MAG: GSCFA domain-containing protein [Cryomorphaceae bacterium]|nr:GSCFA domain-containing protein [Flavobacteriales bacterium]
MKLTTEISFPDFHPMLNFSGHYDLAGSCFSENIGRWLRGLQFKAEVNTTGIAYNPQSIASHILGALSGKTVAPEETEISQGRYVHSDYHSRFSGTTAEKTAEMLNAALISRNKSLRAADVVFITFGTAVVFKRKKDGAVVNNCHKLPADLFEQDMPDEAFFFDAMNAALTELRAVNPGVKICFTVSPVRHLRHGAVTNARSKARLIRLCEMLCGAFDNAVYLPVYEYVIDELRDYRFYRHDDMIHLNEAGMEMLRERLLETLIDPSCKSLLQKITKLRRMNDHHLFYPDSQESRDFIQQRNNLTLEIETDLGRKIVNES